RHPRDCLFRDDAAASRARGGSAYDPGRAWLLYAPQHAADERDANGARGARPRSFLLRDRLLSRPVGGRQRGRARLRLCGRGPALHQLRRNPVRPRRDLLHRTQIQALRLCYCSGMSIAADKISTNKEDLASLTATEAASAIAAREISAEELTRACLSKI